MSSEKCDCSLPYWWPKKARKWRVAFGSQAWLETYMDWISRAMVRFHFERLSASPISSYSFIAVCLSIPPPLLKKARPSAEVIHLVLRSILSHCPQSPMTLSVSHFDQSTKTWLSPHGLRSCSLPLQLFSSLYLEPTCLLLYWESSGFWQWTSSDLRLALSLWILCSFHHHCLDLDTRATALASLSPAPTAACLSLTLYLFPYLPPPVIVYFYLLLLCPLSLE